MPCEDRNGTTVLTGRHAEALRALRACRDAHYPGNNMLRNAIFQSLRPGLPDAEAAAALRTCAPVRIEPQSVSDAVRALRLAIAGEPVAKEVLDADGAAGMLLLRTSDPDPEPGSPFEDFFLREGVAAAGSRLLGVPDRELERWTHLEINRAGGAEWHDDPAVMAACRRAIELAGPIEDDPEP